MQRMKLVNCDGLDGLLVMNGGVCGVVSIF